MKGWPRTLLLAAAIVAGSASIAAPAAQAHPYRGYGGYGFRGGYGGFGFYPGYYGFRGRYAGYGFYPAYGYRGYAPFFPRRPVIYAYPRVYVVRPPIVVLPY